MGVAPIGRSRQGRGVDRLGAGGAEHVHAGTLAMAEVTAVRAGITRRVAANVRRGMDGLGRSNHIRLYARRLDRQRQDSERRHPQQ
ncbi:MAG: hypothetical protein E6K73_13465 [Candidatus Eisenbacteria bacterium]|uniref:Uncharacterized protein n=1 Tax=Eiseniibacteriota bacterium TaxID=2212470 RepID=A0A538S8A2_UNCEI|nr:MAG: hypothetical protein E6K73_13465 [Candidatus Eisenbacteria bacterium]